jgi:hypothetical protein
VPTQQVLNGDFSATESAACQSNNKPVSLKDPSTGQAFANNQIPTSLFSRPSLGLLKYIPLSNDPCGRLVYAAPSPSNENQYIGRADWLQSAKNTIYGRYYIADYANPGVSPTIFSRPRGRGSTRGPKLSERLLKPASARPWLIPFMQPTHAS